MKINLDLIKDFENAILIDIGELKRRGFKFFEFNEWKIDNAGKEISKDKFKQDLIYTYANLRQRMVLSKPRKILYATNFQRLSGYEDGLKLLEDKITIGNDLMSHLSRQIFNPKDMDGMLFDFGIYHLHLGTTPDTKYPFLIQGTKEILYCLFDHEYAYFLVIDDHGKWNDLDLLRIIKDSFPQKLETWEIQGVVGFDHSITSEQRLKLRKSAINVPIELDGKYYISPGGGITTAKTSATAVLEMQRHYRRYKDIEKYVKNYFASDSEMKLKLKTDTLNLSLQSFAPFVLADIEKKVVVELVFCKDSGGIKEMSISKYD